MCLYVNQVAQLLAATRNLQRLVVLHIGYTDLLTWAIAWFFFQEWANSGVWSFRPPAGSINGAHGGLGQIPRSRWIF